MQNFSSEPSRKLFLSSNRLPISIQGLVLKFQLYGQASDLCAELTNAQLKSDDGVSLIVDNLYRHDFMSVISEAYDGFNNLLNARRAQTESLKNFETRFSAAVTKFNSLSKTTKLPQCITALMLLSNAAIDHSQRISALAAAAPSGTTFTELSRNDDFLSEETYRQLASVVKQCEKGSERILNASAATAWRTNQRANSSHAA